MHISSRLLHEIADPHLTRDERALLRCQLAKELEDNYEAAREAMGELWPEVGGRPVLDGLTEATAAEVLLRVGVLAGWLGSIRQIEGAQEAAKNLISESITKFEALRDTGRLGEAQTELGCCYWREGAFDEARVVLREALSQLPADSEVRAIALLRLAIVEGSANRFHDSLRLDLEAAPLFEKSANHAHRGKFHNQFGFVLRNLGDLDRALIEYTAASYHFEQVGHRRYQACVENNLAFLFLTIKKFRDAHEHLDRAQALFTGMQDSVHTAQVDDTRAKVLLAEGRISDAERVSRSAVQVLEKGGEQSLFAEALTTHGLILARMGSQQRARQTLQRAIDIAQNAGDSEAAGLAALTILEELAEHLQAHELSATYDRAAELLSKSENREIKDRLVTAARRVLFLIGVLPSPPTWKGFDFYVAVLRFEAGLIKRALREAGGIVARAAQLLGVDRRNLDAMLRTGRHKDLEYMRTPVEPRRSSLMFRGDEDCPETRAVVVLHVEDDPHVSDLVSMVLEDEGWSVETCADGATALEKLEGGERFDVLIFDYKLPDTTGIELIKQTRKLAHREQTPIIVFSGDDVEAEAKRAGANYFQPKGGDLGAIPETVARLLARRKGREQ